MQSEPVRPRKDVSIEDLSAAVALLNGSEALRRKPNQALLFQYLAKRLLDGVAETAKEYTLAVEALGRDPGFDPKTDSIVRVEMRKLRQTLDEFFESGPGKDIPVALRVPKGAYALEVVPRAGAPPVPPARKPPLRRLAFAAIPLAALAMLAAWFLNRPEPPSPPSRPASAQPGAGPLSTVRILAGNLTEGFTDSSGRQWETDRYFEGGIATQQRTVQIVNVHEPRLFQFLREGAFSYHIPLKPGLYELRLYFAEWLYGQGASAGGGETSRLFRITLNGRAAYEPLDVVAEAPGRGVAMRKVFLNVSPATDGKLHIGFEMLRPDKAFVNAIEVVPGLENRMLPVRMVAAAHPAIDNQGNQWEPDTFALGGRRESRSRPIAGAPSEALFRSERFGHFTYHLHAVRGHRYRLNLWMAGQYFGFPGASATANRSFDLWANGSTLLQSFDPMRKAGGAGRAIRKTFGGLCPDAYGAIRLQFVPVRNYALVNALELLDEGPE